MTVLGPILSEIQQSALDKISGEVTTIEAGSDNTTPSTSDTGVISSIAEVPIDTIDTSVPGQVSFTGKFGISVGNGSTFREVSLKNTTRSSTRDLNTETLKSADQIFWYNITVKARAINTTIT